VPDERPSALLAKTAALSSDPSLADAASRLFDFVQFLLDDEENVTPAGNLNGKAREKLRARVDELLDPVSLADDTGASAVASDE